MTRYAVFGRIGGSPMTFQPDTPAEPWYCRDHETVWSPSLKRYVCDFCGHHMPDPDDEVLPGVKRRVVTGNPTLAEAAACTCVFACAEDPATRCSLSGQFHVHPDDGTGVFGPCPVHPDAPGDH